MTIAITCNPSSVVRSTVFLSERKHGLRQMLPDLSPVRRWGYADSIQEQNTVEWPNPHRASEIGHRSTGTKGSNGKLNPILHSRQTRFHTDNHRALLRFVPHAKNEPSSSGALSHQISCLSPITCNWSHSHRQRALWSSSCSRPVEPFCKTCATRAQVKSGEKRLSQCSIRQRRARGPCRVHSTNSLCWRSYFPRPSSPSHRTVPR